MAKLYGFATGNTLDQELSAKGEQSDFVGTEGVYGAPMFAASKKFELSSQAADTELVVLRANVGFYIHDIIVKFDALGGSVQLRVGDDEDDDRFLTDFSASSAGVKSLIQDGLIDSQSFYYNPATFSNAEDLFVKTKSAAATGTVYVSVYFSPFNSRDSVTIQSLT
tara:strand:- start:259 stop:756 length:498 start_codon:yes stop_codon:yes gene_type:complete